MEELLNSINLGERSERRDREASRLMRGWFGLGGLLLFTVTPPFILGLGTVDLFLIGKGKPSLHPF